MRSHEQPEQPLDYSNQAAVPDHADYFAKWKAESERVRSSLRCHLDLPYGPGSRETCDVFSSGHDGGPVLIFIHGGWWYFLDKSDFSYIAEPFVERGAVVVNINYPLAPGATIEQIVDSVRRAMVWAHQNVARFGGDPGNVTVGGHSAGGHLSTLMAFTDWRHVSAPADFIKINCPVSGVYDLVPILSTPHNQRICMTAATAASFSPIDSVIPSGVVHVAAVGEGETTGFRWQHARFLEACARGGATVIDTQMPRLHHFNVIDQLGLPDSLLFRRVWARMSGTHAG